jgi:hypothetical protein
MESKAMAGAGTDILASSACEIHQGTLSMGCCYFREKSPKHLQLPAGSRNLMKLDHHFCSPGCK